MKLFAQVNNTSKRYMYICVNKDVLDCVKLSVWHGENQNGSLVCDQTVGKQCSTTTTTSTN